MADGNRQQFINASLLVMGFFVISAIITGEWILIVFAFLPPVLFLVMFTNVQPRDWSKLLTAPNHEPANSPSMVTPTKAIGDSPEAVVEAMNTLLEKNPRSPDAHLKRGTAYYALRDWEQAQRDINMTLWLDKTLAPAHFVRGQLLARRGDTDGAIQSWNLALRLDPNRPEILSHLARMLATTGKLDKALEDANLAITNAPSLPQAYSSRGYVHFLKGDFVAAKQDYDSAAAFKADDTFTLAGQAVTRAALDDLDEAKQMWQKLVVLESRFEDVAALEEEFHVVPAFMEQARRLT